MSEAKGTREIEYISFYMVTSEVSLSLRFVFDILFYELEVTSTQGSIEHDIPLLEGSMNQPTAYWKVLLIGDIGGAQ